MNLIAYARSLWVTLFHRSQLAEDMEEELRSHIQHCADDLERGGLSRAVAERRARVEFGSSGRFREESYEALGGNLFDSMVSDVQLALRILRKSPGFAIAAVLTLALAIGANAMVFGLMDGLILRPLNVSQPESLRGTQYGDGSGFQSYPNYLDLRDRNHSFDGLAAFNFAFVGLDTGNNPALATGFAASGNYFDVLRVRPFLGRFFHSADERGFNSAPFVVLTYGYWHSHFQDDREVIGKTVLLDKHPFTVIGVAPPGFQGTLMFISPDFFMPIVNQQQVGGENSLSERGNDHAVFEVFGRLKPGVTPAQANADMNAVGAALQAAYPKEVKHKTTTMEREGLTSFGGAVRAFVAGLMLLAGLILLAACANLGSLFAAHAAERSREVALRLALGSTRKRILRQLLTEATLISLAGGALGLTASVALLRKLSTWQPFPGAPIHLPVTPDAKLYAVAFGLSVVSGFLFGIVPVRQVMRASPYEVIKAGTTGNPGARITVRDVLLVLQIAICAVLVTSSMVAIRGLMRSLHSNLGFEPRNVMMLNANLAVAGYNSDGVLPTQRRLIDAIETIPGVQSVGLVNGYPPLVDTAANRTNVFKDETREFIPPNAVAMPYIFGVSPGYLAAAGTALLAGRDFHWNDTRDAPQVAIANRDFAVKMFGSVTNAIGRYIRLQGGTRTQIAGVVEDGKYLSLTEEQQPAIFVPSLQSPSSQAYVVVRSNRDPLELSAAMRSKLQEVEPAMPADIESWNSQLGVVLFPARMATASLGALGAMGAILSITGIFGMAAFSVSRRLREFGIRMALGAQRMEVLKAALGRALKLLTFGSAAGLILGVLASRVLAAIVYQATPRDPVVIAGVVAAMSMLGLLATWIPAQQALSVNPLVLLREE